jgi:hypothetical protein
MPQEFYDSADKSRPRVAEDYVYNCGYTPLPKWLRDTEKPWQKREKKRKLTAEHSTDFEDTSYTPESH